MKNTQLERLLSEAAERIKREAYSAGWRDAVAAMTKAMNVAVALPGKVHSSAEPASTGRAIQKDSIVWHVLQIVRKRHGLKGSEIVTAIRQAGHKCSDAAIRTGLMRLERKKLIVARNKRWFPA